MSSNPWQYLVLMEGLLVCACAVGLAVEALHEDALRLVGYANIGVALIALSVCATLATGIQNVPGAATWLAATGFAVYLVAATGSWLKALRRLVLLERAHRDYPRLF